MKHWGPADWYVAGAAVAVLAATIWGVLAWFGDNFRLSDFRGPLVKPDPENKVPYHRPEKR